MTTGVPFDTHYKDQFVRLLGEGYPPRVAYRHLDMPFQWRTVKAHIDTDPDFRESVADAIADATGEVEHALYKEAKGGNLGAMRLWLANRGDFVDERGAAAAKAHAPAIGEVSVQLTVDTLRELLTDADTRGHVIEASGRLAAGDTGELEADDDTGAPRSDSDVGGGD